jgi:hypothetical protein
VKIGDGTDSYVCPIAGFSVSSFENSASATRDFIIPCLLPTSTHPEYYNYKGLNANSYK